MFNKEDILEFITEKLQEEGAEIIAKYKTVSGIDGVEFKIDDKKYDITISKM